MSVPQASLLGLPKELFTLICSYPQKLKHGQEIRPPDKGGKNRQGQPPRIPRPTSSAPGVTTRRRPPRDQPSVESFLNMVVSAGRAREIREAGGYRDTVTLAARTISRLPRGLYTSELGNAWAAYYIGRRACKRYPDPKG